MVGFEGVLPAGEVRRAIEDSEFIRGLHSARSRLSDVRSLTKEEVSELEKAGNSCLDWSAVKVGEGFDPEEFFTIVQICLSVRNISVHYVRPPSPKGQQADS